MFALLYRYIFQRCHIDNRVISLVAFFCGLSGSLIATDWQALGGDPCDQFSLNNFNPYINNSTAWNSTVFSNVPADGSGTLGPSEVNVSSPSSLLWCEIDPSDYRCISAKYDIDLDVCEGSLDHSAVSSVNSSCLCEAFSGAPYYCFWNPHSRVVSEDCPRCAPLCRSRKHSLSLVQFLVGLCLINLFSAVGRISITTVVSDAMGTASQARSRVSQ